MKHTSHLFAFILLLFSLEANTRQCTAIADGDWSNGATWSCGTPPTDYDTLLIPLGITVTVDINSPEYIDMFITVDGELYFEVGQKINMCDGGVYVSETGALTGGNPGSKIDICGETVWTGPGPTTGPLYLGSALPVELISFTGTLQETGNVVLNWSTVTETNNNYFTVERSTNGFTYTSIGQVPGHGTSSQVNDYMLNDPTPEYGTNYYRLKQTDYNGQYEYISTIAVEVSSTGNNCVLTVYPNPCQGTCTVNFSDCPEDNDGYITLQVLDAEGQLVSEQIPQRNTEGGFTTSIDSENNLKPGIYVIRGVSAKSSYAERAIVK